MSMLWSQLNHVRVLYEARMYQHALNISKVSSIESKQI